MISDKKVPIIILVSLLINLILPLTSHAQIKQIGIIKGTVIDKENDKPLKDVDIFLANTTIGTTSKPDGTFQMNQVPIGSYQLIFSHLGYIAKAVKVNLYSSNKQSIYMKLAPQIHQMKSITVTGEKPELWQKRLALFTKEFIGPFVTKKECKIENPEVLEFHKDPKSGNLITKASAPLNIINYQLGYQLKVILKTFDWSTNGMTGTYILYPHFIKMKPKNKEQLNEWENQRLDAYKGSLQDFLYAFMHHLLMNNDFDVNRDKIRMMSLSEIESLNNPVYQNGDVFGIKLFGDVKITYHNYYESTISRNHQDYFLVDPLGNLLNPTSISISGYWATKRVAYLLPRYYIPDN